MYKYYCNDELYHYGVKGMRWGVRKVRDSEGNLTKFGANRLQKLNKSADKLHAKEIKRAKRGRKIADALTFTKAGKMANEEVYKANRERIDKKDKIRRQEIAKDFDYYEKSKIRTIIKSLPWEVGSAFAVGAVGAATGFGLLGNSVQYMNKSPYLYRERGIIEREYDKKVKEIQEIYGFEDPDPALLDDDF